MRKDDIDTVLAVQRIIVSDLTSHHTIRQLAQRVNTNQNKLSKNFRQITGCTIHEYVLSKRMDSAKELLQEDRLTIEQVARRCGYKDRTAFAYRFKKYFGYSPSQYRKLQSPT